MTREEVIAMFSDPKDRLSFYETALKLYYNMKDMFHKNTLPFPGYFCYRLYELDHPIMNTIRQWHEENGWDDTTFFGNNSGTLFYISDLFPEIKKPENTYDSSAWFRFWDYDSRIKILENAIAEVKTKI